jgi:TonB family protein
MLLTSYKPKVQKDILPSSEPDLARSARVFMPPPEVIRRMAPPPPRPPAARPVPVPTPPPEPTNKKDRMSIGPPSDLRTKGPMILRKEDDLTKAPKGQPSIAPSAPPEAPPVPAESAQGTGSPNVPGREGLRLPPGLGPDLPRGQEGSKGRPGLPGPALASSIDALVRKRVERDSQLGIPTGTGQNQFGFHFDPQGADFTAWVQHLKNDVYRNWIMPQPALLGIRGHVDFKFTIERDGTMSLLQMERSSGTPALDRAAENALKSSRCLPLPEDYGPPRLTIQVSFFYNEEPQGS